MKSISKIKSSRSKNNPRPKATRPRSKRTVGKVDSSAHDVRWWKAMAGFAELQVPGEPLPAGKDLKSSSVKPPKPFVTPPVEASSSSMATEPTVPAELSRPDALTLYMRAVGEVPLLKPGEEVALADRIRAGDDAAREHMIRANLRFVIKIAREYEHLGMPLLDLINEGNIGLMLAVDRFDPRKGAKLTTYSVLWIRQSIRRALASQGKTIRMPVYAVDQVYHLGRAEMRLRGELGRDATDAELGAVLQLSAERIGELRLAAIRPSSLDAPMGEDDTNRLADVVADENAEVPGSGMDKEISFEILREVLPKLPPREASILRMRFGLEGGVEKTLEEIGVMMRLTRERIRQLQNAALVRLRRLMEERDCISTTA